MTWYFPQAASFDFGLAGMVEQGGVELSGNVAE